MPPRLRPVPDAAPRALGIVRVSKERDDMLSPDIQWAAIEDHCARSGYELVRRLEAIDQSGSQRRSPWWRQLDEAVGWVEAGEFDVVVVWKYSRAARQRMRWAVMVDRIEVAGGRLESATEPFDTSTSAGRFGRGVLAEFNAFQAEQIGDVWRDVHSRRLRAGLPINGKARFGYRVDPATGVHTPHQPEADVLAALYRRYVAGESTYSLVSWLNTEGILTVPGYTAKGPGPWSINGLRQMLDSGFGAGYLTVKGSRQRGAHEPVITPETWTAYLAARERRRPLRRAERSPYLLSSMVWCACGSKMGYCRWGRTNHTALRCLTSTRPGAERHPGAYIRADRVEEGVLDWLHAQADRADADTDAAARRRPRAVRAKHDAKRLARQILELDAALTQLTVDKAKRLIPEQAYVAAAAELTGERDRLERQRVLAEGDAVAGEPVRLAADLVRDWELLSVESRRGGLREIVDRVVVTGWVRPYKVVVRPR